MPSSRNYSENEANDLLKKEEVDGKDLWGLYRASPSSNRLHMENEKKNKKAFQPGRENNMASC